MRRNLLCIQMCESPPPPLSLSPSHPPLFLSWSFWRSIGTDGIVNCLRMTSMQWKADGVHVQTKELTANTVNISLAAQKSTFSGLVFTSLITRSLSKAFTSSHCENFFSFREIQAVLPQDRCWKIQIQSCFQFFNPLFWYIRNIILLLLYENHGNRWDGSKRGMQHHELVGSGIIFWRWTDTASCFTHEYNNCSMLCLSRHKTSCDVPYKMPPICL